MQIALSSRIPISVSTLSTKDLL